MFMPLWLLTSAVLSIGLAAKFKEYNHDKHQYSAGHYGAKFNQWLIENHRTVQVQGHAHYEHMLENFATNEDYIEYVNYQNLSYTLGHNIFSHMDRVEWNTHRGSVHRTACRAAVNTSRVIQAVNTRKLPTTNLSTSLDWSKTPGIVTPVKEQGLCGSCYAFAAIATLESAYNVRHNNVNGTGGPLSSMKSFSEQQVVDCDRNGDSGCVGGAMEDVFDWAKYTGYLCTDASYKYVSGQTQISGQCAEETCDKIYNAAPTSYTAVERGSDQALMEAIAKMPVTVGVDANSDDFQFYKSGVYAGTCGTIVDHGLLAVGWGVSPGGEQYYKFKNCWGQRWGNDGYIKIKRGESDAPPEGRCAILSQISYPNLG